MMVNSESPFRIPEFERCRHVDWYKELRTGYIFTWCRSCGKLLVMEVNDP